MKLLLSVLAVILCVVLLVGLVNGSTSEGGIFSNLGSDSESSSAVSSDNGHDGGIVGEVLEVNGMIYAHFGDDLPIDVNSSKLVASRSMGENETGNIVMGAASNPDGRIAFGYSFSGLKVGQAYVLDYNSIVQDYCSVDHFAYRFGSSSTFYNLKLPNYYNGNLLFEAKATSMDFLIAFFDKADSNLVSGYASAYIHPSCLP